MKYKKGFGMSLLMATTVLSGCNGLDIEQQAKKAEIAEPPSKEAPVKTEHNDEQQDGSWVDREDLANLTTEEKNVLIAEEKELMQKTDQEWGTGLGYTSPDTGYTAKEEYLNARYLAAHITNMWYAYLNGLETVDTFYEMYVPYLSEEFRKTLPAKEEHVKQALEEFKALYKSSNRPAAQYYYSKLEWFGKDINHIDKQEFYRMFQTTEMERTYFKTTMIPKDDHWLIHGDEAIPENSSLSDKFFE